MGAINSLKNMLGIGENFDYDDEEEYYDDNYENYSKNDKKSIKQGNTIKIQPKVQSTVALTHPTCFDDVTDIGKNINEKKIVIINLEDTNKTLSGRIIDFISGVSFANNATIKKVATGTFMVIPENVDASEDFITY